MLSTLTNPFGAYPLAGSLIPLLALLVAAAAIDCRQRRIPNGLIALGLGSAALCQLLLPAGIHPLSPQEAGTPGLFSGLAAGGLVLVIGFALWRLRVFGAGDAKWLAVTAAHAGPALVASQLLLTALAGGLLALVWAAAGRRDPMPYAVAIALGQFGLMSLFILDSAPHP